MQFSRYLKFFIISIPLVLLLIISFNRLINPYALYDGPFIKGINVNKPAISSHLRMSKAAIIRYYNPSSIILGTSRADVGIDPSHPGWGFQPVYNLSLPGTNIYEAFRYLQHTQKISPLTQVLLMLDLSMFNAATNHNSVDFTEDRLAVNLFNQSNPYYLSESVTTLASLDTVISSFKTITNQNKSNEVYFDNGMRNNFTKLMILRKNGDRIPVFNEKNIVNEPYDFQTSQLDNWDIYNQLLVFARQQNIDLLIAITPSSAYEYDKIAYNIGWEKFEYWKRQLVNINEEVANQHDGAPFQLWDFSGYNSYNIRNNEKISLEGKKHTKQWFLDGTHFKKELGDLVLDKIFNYNHPKRIVADDFGVLLNSKNIDQHLYKQLKSKIRYNTKYNGIHTKSDKNEYR